MFNPVCCSFKGPFPCKAISKIAWKSAEGDHEPFVIFSGGMARGSYGDKFTVSVIQGEKHVTFDFTSRVIDFSVLCTADELHRDSGTCSIIILVGVRLLYCVRPISNLGWIRHE